MKSATGALLLTLVASAAWAQVNAGDQKPEASVPFKMETVEVRASVQAYCRLSVQP